MKILWATKIENEDWQEELITEQEDRIPAAIAWAKNHGFNRIRISEHHDGQKPNFSKVLNA